MLVVYVLAILFTFGVVIFVHELGHFYVAKKSGIRVENFAFGLGPELFGYDYKGTRYSLRAIPFGGMVKMAGEYGEDHKGQPDEFLSKPWYNRILIVAAGPIMNYLTAILIFTFVIYVWGIPQPSSEPVAGEIVAGMPADKAGIKPGDRFVKVNNQEVKEWEEVAKIIHVNANKTIQLVILRDGEEMKFEIVPQLDASRNVGLIGIAPKTEYLRTSIFKAVWRSIQQVVGWTVFTVAYLVNALIKWTKPEISGPIGIAHAITKATQGGWQDYLFFLALISTGVGIINFFPIPMFDGGLIVLFLWEGITKKPIGKKGMEIINTIGLVFILFLLVFATYNDIERIRSGMLKKPAEGAQVWKESSNPAAKNVPAPQPVK